MLILTWSTTLMILSSFLETYALRELLKLSESISAKYGLSLSRGKGVTINMNPDEDEICFEDGVKL